MTSLSPHFNEEARLGALRSLRLLDTAPSKAFDRITRIASRLLRVPISSISLLDRDRQYFKSRVGFDLVEAPREDAPCNWTIRGERVCVIPDLLHDERFGHTPLVRRGGMRAYAGAPLITRTGHSLGTLCVMDTQPRRFDDDEVAVLAELAAMVMAQIELQNSIGRIHPVSGYPNEYQLIDDLDDLAERQPGVRRAALLVESVTARQMQQGVRVFGATFVESLIQSSTERIRRALDPRARLYHLSAARCVVLLEDGANAPEATARQLHLSLRDPIDCNGVPVRAEPAIGIDVFVPGQVAARDALRRLYSAVDDARGTPARTAAYAASHDRHHARRFQLLAGLAGALQAEDQLSLVYQPRVDLDGRPRGAEALLRWRDPRHGDISPAEFVPLAEETALIGALTRWVLHHALAQLARWRAAGVTLKLSINVSAADLEEPGFAGCVATLLARHGVPPAAIELEFTESMLARDDGRVITQLRALRAMGIDIAIDDFGTGYSSLAYLQKLPASVLKIDRAFIGDLTASAHDQKLVRAILRMAHDLGYRVVAEGVESAQCAALLRAWGCDEAQGYHFARPLGAEALIKYFGAMLDSKPTRR
ncbi:EAL domain-containing protein (putative c-di-GMP-specific phosphodiesterase class I)/GGDEF domain-containing protein [Duganella sp. 1224]|uniref:sensor domain-containing phosphodiesterase n=1 Tax=Duganella sp. 1224 TaxID=2587052 RepID=UPI0015CA5024|nr:EAL domain-containing protein [Duganella sp. 1224]NYE60797.1 EAL domain-containing protein (putative c-di-GMP-specific phosphodiesterase class I)/GGDEF domain-containing protein [Duganella sp. 1224]